MGRQRGDQSTAYRRKVIIDGSALILLPADGCPRVNGGSGLIDDGSPLTDGSSRVGNPR